jgi:two-component system nitrogen regulation response regulator GlnG
LRERPEDIAPLARHFLQRSARELAVEPKMLTDGALKALCAFSFPGNVRQLENISHWLMVMAPGQRIDVSDLPPDIRESAGPGAAAIADVDWRNVLDRELAQALARGERAVGDRLEREFERTLILRALTHTGGHRMEAARWLGWGRNTLTRKIQELGLEPELKRGSSEPIGT